MQALVVYTMSRQVLTLMTRLEVKHERLMHEIDRILMRRCLLAIGNKNQNELSGVIHELEQILA